MRIEYCKNKNTIHHNLKNESVNFFRVPKCVLFKYKHFNSVESG